MSDLIVWYDRYDREAHKPIVGGKNASLGELMMADLPVPPGFALTTDAYQLLWANTELCHDVNEELAGIHHEDVAANIEASRRIRKRLEDEPVPDVVVDALGAAYEALGSYCELTDVPVAVRSSATAEDLPDASFAGQQDTFLWVQGADAVTEHVRRCWSSLFTDRAIAYRHERGYLHRSISMSVGVQKMVDPVAAGVAFTLNPANGDRSQVAIDASWGLGEAVVSGEVTPDNFLIDKVIHEIVRRNISDKHIEHRLDARGAVVAAPVDEDRRRLPCLSDDDIRNVAALARRAERHYGCPQDVEWAIDRDLPAPYNVVLLQSRPETVWSQRAKAPVSTPVDPMRSIVSTLMSPMHGK